MSPRPFASSVALAALLAAGVVACSDDPLSPTPAASGAGSPAAAVTAAAIYSVKDLGTLGGKSAVANSINNQGGIVGWSERADGQVHAFLYRAGKMQDLGALAGGASEALAINNSDVIVGSSSAASGARRAVRWQNGRITNLGTLGGRNSVATAGPFSDAVGEELDGNFASVFYQAGWTSLGAAEPTIELLAINNDGTVVGWGEDLRDETFRQRAWVAAPGHLDLLPALTPDGVDQVHANDINNFGTIVGSSTEVDGGSAGVDHAVLWRRQ